MHFDIKLVRTSPVRFWLFAVLVQERINICCDVSDDVPLPPPKQSVMKTFRGSPARFFADAWALHASWRSCSVLGVV
jgi:hypothetical protein